MTLDITKHSDTFSSCHQIGPEDVEEVAKLGFKTIINARPDHEGGTDQPTSDSVKAAAEKLGLNYVHIPVIPNNINQGDIEICAQFIANAPTPTFGYCKTGKRATSLYQSALPK